MIIKLVVVVHIPFICHTRLIHIHIFPLFQVANSSKFYFFAPCNELNMNFKYLSLFIIGLCLWIPDVCYAFLEKDVHLLTMQNGLADNTISAICKDKEGFVWFGTRNGLSRYDGRKITNFKLEKGNHNISAMKEVFDGILMFVNKGALSAFDLKKEQFLSVKTSSGEKIPSQGILEKSPTSLWTISGEKLYLVTKCEQEKELLQFQIEEIYSNDAPLSAISYSTDKKSICMVDEKCRIILLDTENLKSHRIIDLGYNKYMSINSVLYDNDQIWISTIGDGIVYYNEQTGNVKELTYGAGEKNRELSHTDVYSIIRMNKNRYLAVTWNGYTVLTVDKNNPDEILTDIYSDTSFMLRRNLETRMIAAYYDSCGILWIGTDGGGVVWSDLRMQFYNSYHQDRHNEICSIVADDNHYLWLATYHKGIMRSRKTFDGSENIDFLQVEDDEIKKRQTVLCSLKDEKGDLWFGNNDGSLTCYHKETKKFSVSQLLLENDTPNKSPIWSLFIDSKGNFWIGTEEGLLKFERKDNKCRLIVFDLPESVRLHIRAIAETHDQTLWLGTANYGLCKIIDEHHLRLGYEKEHSMTGNSIRSLLASIDGNLYVGYTTGLAILSPVQDKINYVYTTQDGLCSNFIGCITEDNNGQIWLGNNSGISRYSRHQHLFYNYYISGSNRSALHYGDILLWGNNKSLTYFNPDNIKAFTTSNPVVITELEVDNQPVETGKRINGQTVLTQSISYTPSITLNHTNRDFSLMFNNLSYSEGQQKYSYRLRPYQHGWLVANEGEKISYANLHAGKYVFEVKNIRLDEEESKVTSLQVEILPHWSETFLFRFCIFSLICIAVYMSVYRIKLRQKRMEHELQLEHEIFTATVERDKEKQIRVEREKFFISAAHELRTPLTLILSPLQELLSTIRPADAFYNKLVSIYRNGTSLQTLVNHLLYVQKIEAGMVKLQISKTDIIGLAKQITNSFRELANAKRFNFTIELPDEPYWLWIDVEKISAAIRNLLSNAFKYTSPNGDVNFTMKHVEIDNCPFCRIAVSDTGKGIPQELQERIFESFITGENTPLFSNKIGIGLHIVKNTMDLHHGKVILDSSPDKGSTFTLLIPEGNIHFSDDSFEIINAPQMEEIALPKPAAEESKQTNEILNKKTTLLIIEDNEEIRRYIYSLFCKDYFIYEAVDGEEGVKIATDKIPDLIISDIMMPVKDGFTCCRELREQPQTAHIPILMLTAKAEDADILRASKIGVDDYMIKPFNPEILKSKVQNLILQRERLKRIYTKTLMLKQQTESNPKTEDDTSKDDFIKQVIQIIEAHISDENFNVKILASQLNMSQPTLYRKIKQRSELAAIDMIRSVRMSKAASLIMENRYSIQEIAEMVGYSDTRTLRKHFIEQFGVAPSKYMENPQIDK